MALQKPEVAEKVLSLPELNTLATDIERADTPVKLLRITTRTLSQLTSVPVSAFAYSATGYCDCLDEHTLPEELRGVAPYPELTSTERQPTISVAAWKRL